MVDRIDRYLILSVTRCKQQGYIPDHGKAQGVIEWREYGWPVASVRIETNTALPQPMAVLSYTSHGVPCTQIIPLRWKPSNLNIGGYYLFACPVTGLSARKLYLVGNRFISRYAMTKTLYKSQTRTRTEKYGPVRDCIDWAKLELMSEQPNRKTHYKGKLTPFGRKMEKLYNRVKRGMDNNTEICPKTPFFCP